MALKISKQTGVYEVQGVLNVQNKEALKKHFELLVNNSRCIKFSVSKIKNLDISGVKFISKIYYKALKKGCFLFIVGLRNKELVRLFKNEQITTY